MVALEHSPIASVPTVKKLASMLATLGSTKTTLWPFWEITGSVARSYGESVHIFTMTDGGTDGFEPAGLVGAGMNSYHFDKANSQHGAGTDSTDFEFGTGAVDSAFSIGAWVQQDVQGAVAVVLAKYDVAGILREWQFTISATNKPTLELFDESANASEIGAATTALTLNTWHFVVVTYDGVEATPGVTFYLDGVADGTGTTETGSYVAMETTATALMLGAADDTAAPTNEFNGRLALPFIAGKELTAANVSDLHIASASLMGVI